MRAPWKTRDSFCRMFNLWAGDCGGDGRFGCDPRMHLIEKVGFADTEQRGKALASWHAHWDNRKTIFVEKTPENLLMTRFLQAAFPNCYFIVIRQPSCGAFRLAPTHDLE